MRNSLRSSTPLVCGQSGSRLDYRDPRAPNPVMHAIGVRREPGMTSEQCAERPQALKSNGKTDACHRHLGLQQQALRALDTPPRQILVRSLAEHLLETPQEVERRET